VEEKILGLNNVIDVNNRVKKILLIEDDRMVSHLIKSFLEKSNYLVQQLFSGDLAQEAILTYKPDLVILDIGLPKIDGFDVCYALRKIYQQPIIVLTAREAEEDQLSAFKLGADDFISKPVSPRVLKARLDAMLRRQSVHQVRQLNVNKLGNIALYPQASKCEVNGNIIPLSSFEFQLLALLTQNAGQVMTRDTIYSTLLSRQYNGVERTVDVRIAKLRDKLLHAGMTDVRIETVWGQGYILNETAA